MKRLSIYLACVAMLFCAGCQKDDADISSDPADLVGKWKEVKETENWKEDGRWYSSIFWEDSAEESAFWYMIFNEDGTYESVAESKTTGEIDVRVRGTWSYSDKKIHYCPDIPGNVSPDDYEDYGDNSEEVVKLTSSELILRDWAEDYSCYDDYWYVRIE